VAKVVGLFTGGAEFPWDKEALPVVYAVNKSCKGEEITVEEVQSAIKKMRYNNTAGSSGVVADMLKAAGDTGTRWITNICNRVIKEGRIPEDRCKSWMVNVYKEMLCNVVHTEALGYWSMY